MNASGAVSSNSKFSGQRMFDSFRYVCSKLKTNFNRVAVIYSNPIET